ncbi:ZZ-type zinc finger-containing protein 3 isoform X2 [Monomorium pharaonis]|uniref:ZZ-type zinc finger-containing protein 3 isoform X2 n=1 Tax=Monomorium pharaonis TaxID=307658 RepID=UPI00174666CB|nr:ZZ-type zinc finger-containing protein 3 isoform X2 [Monomorium pharaonis]
MNDEEARFPNEEENEFYFESDHLALRGNKDYNAFLKTIVILEAQRVQAIEDLDKLMSVRAEAMKDPISFVARLQNDDLPQLPGPQKIAEVPYVDWSQYNVTLPDIRMRPKTRHKHVPQVQIKTEQENEKVLVRGRAFDESKPETFNQLWTVEEQRRLEELLVEYPPEEVEMRRWTKIANALGLPIPGRGPKLSSKLDVKKSFTHKQRNNHLLFKRSTFFPHQDISFTLDESKEQPLAEESEDDTPNGGSDDNPELRQINLLRQVKAEKEQDSPIYKHVGYKCTVCDEEPLRGTRWHCSECHSGIDLCGDCAVAQLEEENPLHDPSHKLIPIKPPPCTRSYDLDYFPQNFSNSSYNYLDPNFLPE